MSATFILFSVLAYMAFLFFIARWGEGRGQRLVNTGWAYGLSLAVYCTTWTFYGSVGMATQTGLLFSSIYVGVILSSFFYPSLLKRIVFLKENYSITSLADLISIRHDKSLYLGALVTVMTVVGIIPYIALQLKAIEHTTIVLLPAVDREGSTSVLVGLGVPFALFIFTLLFGLRRVDPTERHPGMVFALVAECIFKLIAILAVGGLATLYLWRDVPDLAIQWRNFSSEMPFLSTFTGKEFFTWIMYLILAGVAGLFLPRQFHMAVVENQNKKHIDSASWIFPIYLFLINVPVIPIAFAGFLLLGMSGADYFVLNVPVALEKHWLSFLAYVGGFSAGTGMVMVETMAVATMVSNNIVLPLVRGKSLAGGFQKVILFSRWGSAAALIACAYGYAEILGNRYGLVSIGMVSFAAILQFAPVTLVGLFWEGGTQKGAKVGLWAGFGLWLYMLFIPAIVRSYFPESGFLVEGPWGITWLRPSTFLGIEGAEPVPLAAFVSLFFNLACYVFVSLLDTPTAEEREWTVDFMQKCGGAAERSVTPRVLSLGGGVEKVSVSEKKGRVRALLVRYVDSEKVDHDVDEIFKRAGVSNDRMNILQLAEVNTELERRLAGSLGVANAHLLLMEDGLFSESESKDLSLVYADLLAEMKISPKELREKISFYQERERLLRGQAQDLERQVAEKSSMLLQSSKFAALGQMAGGVAHEINSPLAIIGVLNGQLSDMVNEGELNKDSVLHVTSRVEKTVERIAKIVKGLRSFARQDGDVSDMREVSLFSLVEDSLALCEEKFKNHGVKVEKVGMDHSYSARCNAVQVVQVILNLLNNSFDAVEKKEDPWVKIELSPPGEEWIEMRITDSGKCIPKETVERLFTPFFTTKGVGKGTGLGLSISKGIMEQHGGQIFLDETCPTTSFILRFPKIAVGKSSVED